MPKNRTYLVQPPVQRLQVYSRKRKRPRQSRIFNKEDARWMRLQVTDTGVGMSADHIQHIFESFYQIDVHHAGSGIGLALVKAFVEMHGGTIHVDSAEGQGTRFCIEMPAHQTGALDSNTTRSAMLANLKEGAVLAADQETIQVADHDTKPEDKETILVIDDNQDIRDYVRSVLQENTTSLRLPMDKRAFNKP